MKNDRLWTWEKHNVLTYIQKRFSSPLGNPEFTLNGFCHSVQGYVYDYGNIDRYLTDLVKDDKISVRYISKKCVSGYKTIGVYKLK